MLLHVVKWPVVTFGVTQSGDVGVHTLHTEIKHNRAAAAVTSS